MTRFDRGTLTCPRLVDYFLLASKPRPDWHVGMEIERMGVDAHTGRSIPYAAAAGAPSVRGVLEEYLARRGGEPVYEGDHLIGIDAGWGSISLEPGGQVEWSSRPLPDLDVLRAELADHGTVLQEIGRSAGVRWLSVGVHPDQPVEDMPWMPKARYGLMRDYLGRTGRLAHRMMTQTTGVQCAFDYADAQDWVRKFRAAALLTPAAVALFANSSRADGRDTGFQSFRQAIWREVDPARCGLPPIVFDPGFDVEAWVEWVCDVPAIFRHRTDGLVSAGGHPFRRCLERVGCDAVGVDDWELHLSSVFTEVRSYTYIEVRSADLLPDPYNIAVPALWTGLLYDDDALDAALRLGAPLGDHARWLDAMHDAARLGLEGAAAGHPLRELAGRMLAIATASLRGGAACGGQSGRVADLLGELGERRRVEMPRAVL